MYSYSNQSEQLSPWTTECFGAADAHRNFRLKYPVTGQIRDANGTLWNIRDTRPTKHGFDLQFGNVATEQATSLPCLIVTPELFSFWDINRLRGHGFLFDLPAGRTTLKRARRRFGFNFDDDHDKFWHDRLEDLATLDKHQFAAKHGVTPSNAVGRRAAMIGRRARPLGWWRTPEIIAILQAKLTRREAALKLGIGISHASRLSHKAAAINAEHISGNCCAVLHI